MSGIMPLDELLELPTVTFTSIDSFTVLPMGPDNGDPVYLVPGSSHRSGIRVPSQLALHGLDPTGPVLRVLEFDNQDRPECVGQCTGR